jgi:hypothetical protein
MGSPEDVEHLAVYRHCVERIRAMWADFLRKRSERLTHHPFQTEPVEKVTESILEDLFTYVLDWPLAGFNPQVEHADIALSNLGIRWVIVEAKRPGTLAWHRRAVDEALDQAVGYASAQQVRCVAVSDGVMLYAADLVDGGKRDRVFVSLAQEEAPADLWWLSVQGIYRLRGSTEGAALRLLPEQPVAKTFGLDDPQTDEVILHPKYKLPARCFAYVSDPLNPRTWKLPYLCVDGSVDLKRLPKAIQCIVTNYRGTRVSGLPESAIRAILERLAQAAQQAGHLPPTVTNPAPVYLQLIEVLKQLGIATPVL